MKTTLVTLLAAVAVAISLSALGVTLVAAKNQSQTVYRDVPGVISYQGFLTGSKGQSIADGKHTVVFRIYGDAIANDVLWQESHGVVTSQGAFAVLLGSNNAIDRKIFGKGFAYLGVQVDKDSEMKPRQALSSVPFAMIAEQAGSADRLSCTGCVTSAHLSSDAKTATSGGVTRMESPNGEFSVEVTNSGVFLEGPSGLIHMSFDEIRIDADYDMLIFANTDIIMDSGNNFVMAADGNIDIASGFDISLNAVGNTEIKSNFDISIESNTRIDIDGGFKVNVDAVEVNLDGAANLRIDGGNVALNGNCNGVSGFGDQVIVIPTNGIGQIMKGSSIVFVC